VLGYVHIFKGPNRAGFIGPFHPFSDVIKLFTREQYFPLVSNYLDCLCGLVARVLGYRSGDRVSIPGHYKKKVVGLERGPLSLVSTTEELLDRKVAAPV
jgi:hypothetical protein